MGNGVAKVLGKKDDDALLKIFIAYDKDDSDSLDVSLSNIPPLARERQER